MMSILTLIAWFAAHQTLLLMVTTSLLMFEQWLGQTDRLKSNSTLQLIGNICAGIINVLRIIYKVATGKAMVTMLDGSKPVVTPAQPTPADLIQKAIESPAAVLAEGQAVTFQKAFEAGAESIQSKLEEK